MKPNADDQPLREKIWRHELTPAEQAELRAWLAAHPESAAELETEKNLTGLLSRLPDAPVPSNFTARVLQAVERETRTEEGRKIARGWWLRVLLPRAAVVAAVIGGGFFSYQSYQSAQRAKFVEGLAAVTGVAAVPGAETLEDFEVIRRLPEKSVADEELISLLAALE
jgi:anti-sigma factor RsiW